MRISDIEGAIRRARKENKQISGRVKVHSKVDFNPLRMSHVHQDKFRQAAT